MLEKPLLDLDPEVAEIMKQEVERQRENIVLIASENVTSRSVFDALGSPMSSMLCPRQIDHHDKDDANTLIANYRQVL